MAQIAPTPIILNDIDLLIGADNYEASVSKAELVPTAVTAQWKGMTPGSGKNLAGEPTWVLNLDYAQDHATAASLAEFLRANAGTVQTIKLKPKKPVSPATAPTYTVAALIVPGPIGGALDQLATGSVSLPVNGQPARTLA